MRGTMTVGADGKLYPCHRYVGMSNFVIGHIDDGPDIEMAKEYWRKYDKVVRDRCDACWARHVCNRPCPWEISNADGTFRNLEEWDCNWRRRNFERGAYVHYRLQKDYPEMYDQIVNPPHLRKSSTRPSSRQQGLRGKAEKRSQGDGQGQKPKGECGGCSGAAPATKT